MLELLNQLDGFSSTDDVKVISFTNSADVLEPNPDNYEVNNRQIPKETNNYINIIGKNIFLTLN